MATNVTVNTSNALFYGDATFAATNMPLTTTYTAVASGVIGTNSRSASNTVTVSLSTNITFQYDANGNLTNDGLRSLAYDDENQLIQVWVTSNWMSQFSYDGKMRRRIREEFAWQGTNWVQTNAVYYVYDGNLVIQERDINKLPTTTYTRGKDLSGSLEGAGGIGGLLARTSQAYADAPLAGHSFYHADGNGNVTMLINSEEAVVATYLYDVFGNVLSKSGLLSDANLYQFSSKEKHLNSGLVYYLYRYYDPNLQRWLNRDPASERGGLNLFTFVANDPVQNFDLLGLACSCGPDVTTAVNNTLQAIKNAFQGAAYSQQLAAAQSLYGPGANGAWDITALQILGQTGGSMFQGQAQLGTGSCSRTVVYKGVCVYAGSLNYIGFGLMNRLAHDKFVGTSFSASVPFLGMLLPYDVTWSLADAIAAVTFRKNVQLGDFSETAVEAIDFTAIGYQGYVPWYYKGIPLTGGLLGGCNTAGSKPVSDISLHGHFGVISF